MSADSLEPDKEVDEDKAGHFQNYADYSRTLRTWLVAYGIGGPVIFLTNDKVADRVAKSGHSQDIVALFLFGVGLQVVLSFINKWVAWHLYRGAEDAEYQETSKYKFWHAISEQSWLDLAVDFASLVALGFASWRVLNVFLMAGRAA
jgi:hypothetical protein